MAALVACVVGSAALADPSDLCLSAARTAAAQQGVPAEMMIAVGLAETGRRQDGVLRPWPWTANLNGEGFRFDSAAELQRFASAAISRGETSIDIGCFQVNYRWHGDAFGSLEQMIDPLTNARYAAYFLRGLADELGGWQAAVGAYHSRSPPRAAAYRQRVADLQAGLPPEGGFPALPPPTDTQIARLNSFPLLGTGGNAGALGSLVPLGGDGA